MSNPDRDNVREFLSPYRVAELGDHRTAFAGSLLVQLGAEVVLFEPPGGTATRREPPLATHDRADGESVWHLAFNRGKRSVMIDWSTPHGAAELDQHLAGCDAVLLSGGPRELADQKLPAIAELSARHPHLVVAAISPFGQVGPKADWAGSDLVCSAASVPLSITGVPNRPPLRTSVPQVYLHASAEAVVGVLLSLMERTRSGCGDIVDVSAQDSWQWVAGYYAYNEPWGGIPLLRNGAAPTTGRLQVRYVFPAADGHVTITVLVGAAVGPFTNRLVAWMHKEGECPDALASIDWCEFRAGKDPSTFQLLNDSIADFTARRSRHEIVDAAREYRLLIAPVHDVAEVLAFEQFDDRGAWQDILVGDRAIKMPGPFVRLVDGAMPVTGSAPTLDADRDLVCTPRPANPDVRCPSASLKASLDGLRVLDLTTSFAGPLIGRVMASFGAQVVKVESRRRPDLARAAAPFSGTGPECSLPYAHTNAGKWSVALDLSQAASREVLLDLVKWADVLVEAFAPGVAARLGLDPTTIRDVNPSLVVLQSTMLGQTGPYSSMPGYGNMASAMTGLYTTTSWPDGVPVGPAGAYTDFVSPQLALAAILSAVDHRRRTGEGSWFDFGQGESVLQLLGVALADWQLSGRSWDHIGNADPFRSPHGVYPAAGDDNWIAIACTSETQWAAFAHMLGRDDLAQLDVEERLARTPEIDGIVADWTQSQAGEASQQQLQTAGIAAHVVQSSHELWRDPQIVARGGNLTAVEHDVMGQVLVGLPAVRFRSMSPTMSTAAPTIGQHTFDVLHGLLGYDINRITALATKELLE